MYRFLFFVLFAALAPALAGAAPIAPGQGPISGDIVQLNQQFHLDYYNFRVQSIRWVSGDDAFARGLANAPSLDEAKGLILITVALKSTAKEAQYMPLPDIQVQYKDATQSDEDPRTAYTTAGKEVNGDYQPGQGLTVVFYIENMPKPTADNPISKVIFKPHNGGDNDSGAPKIFRMLTPPVAP